MNVYDTWTKPIAIQLYLHITNFYVSIFSKILFKHIFTPLLSQMSDVKIDNRNTDGPGFAYKYNGLSPVSTKSLSKPVQPRFIDRYLYMHHLASMS